MENDLGGTAEWSSTSSEAGRCVGRWRRGRKFSWCSWLYVISIFDFSPTFWKKDGSLAGLGYWWSMGSAAQIESNSVCVETLRKFRPPQELKNKKNSALRKN